MAGQPPQCGGGGCLKLRFSLPKVVAIPVFIYNVTTTKAAGVNAVLPLFLSLRISPPRMHTASDLFITGHSFNHHAFALGAAVVACILVLAIILALYLYSRRDL